MVRKVWITWAGTTCDRKGCALLAKHSRKGKNPSWLAVSATTESTSCPRSVCSRTRILNGKLDLSSEISCLDSPVLWSRSLEIMWHIHLNWIMEVFMTKCKTNDVACNIVLVLFILILNVILCCSYNFHVECAYYFEFKRAQVHHWSGNMRFGRMCVGCWGSGEWWCEVWHYSTKRPFLLKLPSMKQIKNVDILTVTCAVQQILSEGIMLETLHWCISSPFSPLLGT